MTAWLDKVFDNLDENQIGKDPGRVVIRIVSAAWNTTIRCAICSELIQSQLTNFPQMAVVAGV